MKKLAVILALSALSIAALVASAPAQDEIYLTEPTVVDMSRVLPRYDAALWNLDFKDNPALLTLDCPYEFISDLYYLGGYRHIATDGGGQLLSFSDPPALSHRTSDMRYYNHGLGADVGFALKLNDRTNFAAIFGYRWNHISGDGDFVDNIQRFGEVDYGLFNGKAEDNFNSHAYDVSLLISSVVSDRVTYGAGLKIGYTRETYDTSIDGFGISNGALVTGTESADLDRELTLRYYRIGPVLGIALKPMPKLAIDASVEGGFYMGDVQKEASYLEEFTGNLATFLFRDPSMAYNENFNASELNGWDMSAKVNAEYALSEKLSFPVYVAFDYRDFRWSVGGLADGLFGPFTLLEFGLAGDGEVLTYNDNENRWDIAAGAGVKYVADWGTITGMLSYTHRDLRDNYGQADFDVVLFDRRDRERLDILSLGIVYEKEFSPMFSADLGLRYDVGWGRREVGSTLIDDIESLIGFRQLITSADAADSYQNLTLSTHMTLKPMDHLTVGLGGMVTIPLNTLDYDMHGSASGLEGFPFAARPALFYGGPFSMGYETTGWDWGGLLSVTYEFGCPVATPPPAAPAPVIEPKLEPMSYK
jgi:hypothetical protein